MLVPVILSGGSGTRLWPLSRELYPKQLIPFLDNKSLLQATLSRLQNIDGVTDPIIICNEEHRFLVSQQAEALGYTNCEIMLEPLAKNTAPAIASACIYAKQRYGNANLLVLPADHLIEDEKLFTELVNEAQNQLVQHPLICFGVVPNSPHTGYGYIETERNTCGPNLYRSIEFVEKPKEDIAKQYVAAGNYYWNSGMFLFQLDFMLQEMKKLTKKIFYSCEQSVSTAIKDNNFIRLNKKHFEECENISFDYAVMEKTNDVYMMPLSTAWSDVGAWSTFWDVGEKDDSGNVIEGDVFTHNVKNSYIKSDGRLLAVLGLEDCVVVETNDAVLLASKSHAQEVKEITKQLSLKNRKELKSHTKVYRPWGSYQTVDESSNFKVKRLIVNSGSALSLQMHNHRSEHWVVVKGTAKVTKGDETFDLHENQSTYIPVGIKHRLENATKFDLEIIEVQTGAYLEEDDIVRFDDQYGRETDNVPNLEDVV